MDNTNACYKDIPRLLQDGQENKWLQCTFLADFFMSYRNQSESHDEQVFKQVAPLHNVQELKHGELTGSLGR